MLVVERAAPASAGVAVENMMRFYVILSDTLPGGRIFFAGVAVVYVIRFYVIVSDTPPRGRI